MSAPADDAPPRMTGPEKAAVVLLSLGKAHGALWRALGEREVEQVAAAMARLEAVPPALAEALLDEFVTEGAGLAGGLDADQARDLLCAVLPPARAAAVLGEAHGRAASTWERLGQVGQQTLARYLMNEHPQTVAVILARLRPDEAARVISSLPEEFALECVVRMLRMEPVRQEALDLIEAALRTEFVAHLAGPAGRDGHELMAEVFNSFDAHTESRFLSLLDQVSRPAAERIRALMFVFEDLVRLDPGALQTLLRVADREQLTIALKGASEPLRLKFYANMTERAARVLREDMGALGPVRLRDVDAAQAGVVQVAKELAARGEILTARARGDDELVY